MRNRIVIALLAALLLTGCEASCFDRDDNDETPPIDITAPDGKHIARIGLADCSGFRVDTTSRVRIATADRGARHGTVVFEGSFDFSKVEWIDANHLSIIIDEVRLPKISERKAENVKIIYRLDPFLTKKYIEGFHSESFIRWAKDHVENYPFDKQPL